MHVYDEIKNPKELFNYINERWEEGFISRIRNKVHVPKDKDYKTYLRNEIYYRTNDYMTLPDLDYATLFEKIEFARFWLDKNDYDYKVLFIFYDLITKKELPHNAFIVYKEDNLDKVYYYMELSDYYDKGMYRFNSYKQAINYVRDKFIEKGISSKKKLPDEQNIKIYHYDHIFNASYSDYIQNTQDLNCFSIEIDHTKQIY